MANARLFEHNDFRGRQLFIDNPAPQRYLLATFGWLNDQSFNDIGSSLRLGASSDLPPNTCILFEHPRFQGNFRAFAYNGNRDINALSGFNDVTSTVLLISHDPNPRKTVLNIKSLAGARLNTALDERLREIPEVRRRADVSLLFAIDVHEIGQFGNDLVKIEVPLTIVTPWPLSNVNAEIGYYVDLFINGDNVLQGAIVGWWYRIDGSWVTNSIEGRLRPQVEGSIGEVEAQLNSMLRELNWHRWTDVYLLPGRGSVNGDFSGNISDDCTIVLPFMED